MVDWGVTHPPERAQAWVVEVRASACGNPDPVRRVHILEARDSEHAMELGRMLALAEFGLDALIMTAVVRQVDHVEGLP